MSMCFMVNAVPDHTVVHTRCNAPPNCEYQFPIESCSEQFKDLISLFIIWEIGRSPCSVKVHSISGATTHGVSNNDCSDIRIPIATHSWHHICGHCSMWLVPHHYSEDCEAHRASDPLLIAD